MIVSAFEQTPADTIARWHRLHAIAGTTVHQRPEYVAAVAGTGVSTLVVDSASAIGAFALRDGVAVSLGATRALLTSETVTVELLERVCAEVARASGAPLVYFPQVHAATVELPDRQAEVAAWPRLPSPYVDCVPGEDLWARVQQRYGSRAARQRRRAEARCLVQRTLAGEEAVNAVDRVERRTWKAWTGQSMHDRDHQFALFARLLRDGMITASTLHIDDHPVAFRLDGLVRRTVCCLKWSYDEAYRSCSPGFYLLTYGLARDWDHRTVSRIDLFGSPDTLKALIATGQAERVDLAWPRTRTTALSADRLEHDRRTAEAFSVGVGLRRLHTGVDARSGHTG